MIDLEASLGRDTGMLLLLLLWSIEFDRSIERRAEWVGRTEGGVRGRWLATRGDASEEDVASFGDAFDDEVTFVLGDE